MSIPLAENGSAAPVTALAQKQPEAAAHTLQIGMMIFPRLDQMGQQIARSD